ncbi:hypothetical protein ACJRO7_018433 [Eucalyptus globulus]|uniref:Uncharacterized protein n=1 Tax=Eucalyptus globulus TaxID=34317 RepID=A0ABD3KTR9_EUCGL
MGPPEKHRGSRKKKKKKKHNGTEQGRGIKKARSGNSPCSFLQKRSPKRERRKEREREREFAVKIVTSSIRSRAPLLNMGEGGMLVSGWSALMMKGTDGGDPIRGRLRDVVGGEGDGARVGAAYSSRVPITSGPPRAGQVVSRSPPIGGE